MSRRSYVDLLKQDFSDFFTLDAVDFPELTGISIGRKFFLACRLTGLLSRHADPKSEG